MGGRRSISLALTALLFVTLSTQSVASAAAHGGESRGGREPRVRAPQACSRGHRCDTTAPPLELVWLGRAGDVVADTAAAGAWRVADGYADATLTLKFGVSGRLTFLYMSGAGGCFWSTDPAINSWGIAVTRQGSMRLLNVGESRAINLEVRSGQVFTLHMQEPHGYGCASPASLQLTATIDGVDYYAALAT